MELQFYRELWFSSLEASHKTKVRGRSNLLSIVQFVGLNCNWSAISAKGVEIPRTLRQLQWLKGHRFPSRRYPLTFSSTQIEGVGDVNHWSEARSAWFCRVQSSEGADDHFVLLWVSNTEVIHGGVDT